MELISVGNELEVDGIWSRMKLLYAKDHCPRCALLPAEHDDEACSMRYSKEDDLCALSKV